MTATQNAQRAMSSPAPMPDSPAAPIHPTDDQRMNDTQGLSVVGGEVLRPGQIRYETQAGVAGSDPSLTDGHSSSDTHVVSVVGEPNPATDDQSPADTHRSHVVGGTLAANHPTTQGTTPMSPASDGWLELRIWAEMFDDAQKARIANVNRAERGGADPDIFGAHIAELTRTEHACRLAMRRTFRRVAPKPIIEWQKATNGIGIDLLARLLGHMGNPRWATPHHWEGTGSSRILITDPPFERTVGQLWQYAGHGAPGRKWKGMTADDLAAQGSPMLKMLVHLNAEACMKCMTSPFRLVYEQTRQAVADKVHTVECVRCGPSGKPAQPGSPWSPGHQHAHALRIVGKEILRDLWMVAA